METKSKGSKEIYMERKIIEREPKQHEEASSVAVIYYLSRNGQLDHPHLMEVPISSPHRMLCLKDVMNRLSFLRGQGMGNMYSWSSKRSYKKGYVWQDLCENDIICPSRGHDYVLKGTPIIETSLSFRPSYSYETTSLSSNNSSTDDIAYSPATIKLYKAKTCREFAGKVANASTQTEERQRKMVEYYEGNENMRLSSASFGSLLEGCNGSAAAGIRNHKVENEQRPSGRFKASEILMHLIRCQSSSIV